MLLAESSSVPIPAKRPNGLVGKMICAQPLHYTFGAEHQLSKDGVKVSLILLEPRYVGKLITDLDSDLDMAL